eukprot:CAMPEP_0177642054 /NCGR_PEP_ID=MMETSP0447-20121125/7386_1 /TAXON_ID=0 /ORGANISM="Stygamoeba regulata, Strain BSH-02190019" /LENGTH=252 /DNA_ID=CAMNT_0019144195 /DNA_START=274 /DNA_END=1032 /DNA_ORIENTATION=+
MKSCHGCEPPVQEASHSKEQEVLRFLLPHAHLEARVYYQGHRPELYLHHTFFLTERPAVVLDGRPLELDVIGCSTEVCGAPSRRSAVPAVGRPPRLKRPASEPPPPSSLGTSRNVKLEPHHIVRSRGLRSEYSQQVRKVRNLRAEGRHAQQQSTHHRLGCALLAVMPMQLVQDARVQGGGGGDGSAAGEAGGDGCAGRRDANCRDWGAAGESDGDGCAGGGDKVAHFRQPTGRLQMSAGKCRPNRPYRCSGV